MNKINSFVYRLDGPLRLATGENLELVKKANLRTDSFVLDLGAGTGYVTIPLAKAVFPDGKVYAVDKSKELCSYLYNKAVSQGVRNIHYVQTGLPNIPFPDNYFDAVTIAYLLHEIPDIVIETLQEAYRVLKPCGRIVIADYRKIADAKRRREIEHWYSMQNEGPEEDDIRLRYSFQDIEKFLIQSGFSNINISSWLYFHMHVSAEK